MNLIFLPQRVSGGCSMAGGASLEFGQNFCIPKAITGKKRPNHYPALMISESFFKGSAIL